jgi:hypothetical protein
MIDNLTVFFLKSSLIIAVLYLGYWFLLRKESCFKFNRMYLLLIILLSFMLPFMEFSLPQDVHNTTLNRLSIDGFLSDNSDTMMVSLSTGQNSSPNRVIEFDPFFLLPFIYLSGIIINLCFMLFRIKQLLFVLRNPEEEYFEGIKLFKLDRNMPPFSFFNRLFINPEKYSKIELAQIIRHERTHIEQRHSIDLILLELFRAFHWYNPIAYLICRSLRYTHEYIADCSVIKHGFDKKNYQHLILRQACGSFSVSLTNSFVCSETSRRIAMLSKKQSHYILKIKSSLLIPFIFVLILFLQGRSVAVEFSIQEGNIVFNLPLPGGTITSGFEKIINPFTKKVVFHSGIDIAVPRGTQIQAAGNGVVLAADSVEGHGNRIIIQHTQGFTSHYSHLLKINVTKNENLISGKVIGLVGSTGLSTAPHLHFEIQNNGKALDPADYLDFSNFKRR